MNITMEKEDCLNIDDEDWENIFKLDEPIFSDLVSSFDVKPLLTEDDINLGFEEIVSELTENDNIEAIEFDQNAGLLQEGLPENYIDNSFNVKYDEEDTNQLNYMICIPPVSILQYLEEAVQLDNLNEGCETNVEPSDNKLYNCIECKYMSDSWHNYMDHMYNHEYSNKFACNICKKRYHGKRSLNLHFLIHIIRKKMGLKKRRKKRKSVGNKVHECPRCLYKTNLKNNLTRHITTHDDVKPFECEICQKQFKSVSQLKIHIYTHSDIKRFSCNQCDYQTNRKSILKQHCKDKHFVETPYKSVEYTYETSTSTNLDTHVAMDSVGIDKQFKCSYCSYQTDLKSRLKRHVTVHYSVKPFTCDVCHESFKRKEQLQRHKVRRHIEDKKYECWECDYKTNAKEHIKRHLLTHNSILPFQCDVCNKRFKLSQSLKSHSYTHMQTKEFQCIICDYRSDKRKNFLAHLRNQHPGVNYKEAMVPDSLLANDDTDLNVQVKKDVVGADKKYKCSMCNYQTDYKSHLTRHMFVHDNTKPFECTTCHQRFVQKVQLLSHIGSKHVDEKVHKCSLCNYETNNKYHFKQHLATHDRRQMDPQKMSNDWENWTNEQARELQSYMSAVDVK